MLPPAGGYQFHNILFLLTVFPGALRIAEWDVNRSPSVRVLGVHTFSGFAFSYPRPLLAC